MNVDRAVLGMAGSFVLLSVLLGLTVSGWWFAFTVFVGANMVQASFTGFCPAALIFRKLGMRDGCAFKGKNG
ncbi:MAG: YgaP family membrane protein [Oceanipulchritudo sp.]